MRKLETRTRIRYKRKNLERLSEMYYSAEMKRFLQERAVRDKRIAQISSLKHICWVKCTHAKFQIRIEIESIIHIRCPSRKLKEPQ